MRSLANAFKAVFKKDDEKNAPFPGSSAYWQNRYKSGGNSGAGSYDLLAKFKADTINSFVDDNNIGSVIEFGCGDGNQLSLATYNKYIGFDVSEIAIKRCKDLFKSDDTKSFKIYERYSGESAPLTISLDVIYHLIEDDVYDQYMERLFSSSDKYVIIYSSNKDEWQERHVRHRKFTEWVDSRRPGWKLVSKIPNKYPFDRKRKRITSFADFYIFMDETAPGDN